MLVNTPYYVCQNFKKGIEPCSSFINTKSVPKNFLRTGDRSFLFCEMNESSTSVKQMKFRPGVQKGQHFFETEVEVSVLCETEGAYSSWNLKDESALLINREGDLCLLNLLTKDTFLANKQHPGLYSDTQVLSIGDHHYVTCGGCVKNSITNEFQRIIKVWEVDSDDNSLNLECRINTGHKKPVQASLPINDDVVTLSTDKTIRVFDLSTESIRQIISTTADLYSGAAIDFNCLLAGGMGKSLLRYDLRHGKSMQFPTEIPRDPIQITKIVRFDETNFLVACINEVFRLDLRMNKLELLGTYEGERISEIMVIDREFFVIGNREKNLQLWRAF